LLAQTVVAETFDDIVNNPTVDVLVYFYAASSEHCTRLMPIYEELARKVRPGHVSFVVAVKQRFLRRDQDFCFAFVFICIQFSRYILFM